MSTRALRRGTGSRARGDEGVSLILAMAFLSLLGVLVASLLTVVYSSTKTTVAVRDHTSNLYGADGGTDVAVQLLRNSSTYCPNVSSYPSAMPTQTIGGRSVALTCQTISGTVGGTGGGAAGVYAVVVTGYNSPGGSAPDFTKLVELDGKDKDGSDSTRIEGGHMFNAGKFNFKSDSPALIIDKNLDQYNGASPYCTDDQALAASTGQPQVSGTWTCRTAASFPVPDPNPTLVVPTANAPAPIVVGDCTILFPGRYTSAPSFNRDKKYYFASGVYLFDGTKEVKPQGEVFGGQPGPGITQTFTDQTPCSNDAAANALLPGTATGFGIQIVLSGDAKLQIEDERKAKIELFARVPANPAIEGSPGVTIYAPKVSGTGYSAWDKDRAVDIKGKEPQLVIHGLVYIPTSKFDEQFALANENAGFAPIFHGGLVVQRLKLKFKPEYANLTFARIPANAATTRTTVVTATATDPSGGAPITIQAVAQLGTGSGVPATILSWRKV